MQLLSTPKTYTFDLDKSCPPQETIDRVENLLASKNLALLQENKRVDTGRLGIPVYMSMCGEAARHILPVRKQMGKGATPEQARTSALMELVERYSYFSFWTDCSRFQSLKWHEAKTKFGARLLPVEELLRSVGENLTPDKAETVLDLVEWKFAPVTRIVDNQQVMAPLDWFKLINEFNGASAGNNDTESVLQGACEVVERHVCALIAKDRIQTPTLDVSTARHPILRELVKKFHSVGIRLVLKNFSLDTNIPTVAALAWDPATFPHLSEIVFTAGTASSPEKAAIRALTEVAQLAGDFESASNFEPSGLPKFHRLEETQWLQAGEVQTFASMPSLEADDFLVELRELAGRMQKAGLNLYAADFTHPDLGLPAHYSFAPGCAFRERAQQPSLGLFTARVLLENDAPSQIETGLHMLETIYGRVPFLLFFRGMLHLQQGDLGQAAVFFGRSETGLTDKQDQGLAAFYQAYSRTQEQKWEQARPMLERAIGYDDSVKEFHNLLGVCFFKQQDYERAARCFQKALDLDSSSAMDMANLGLCHKFLGEKDTARICLRQALVLDSSLEFAVEHLRELEEKV